MDVYKCLCLTILRCFTGLYWVVIFLGNILLHIANLIYQYQYLSLSKTIIHYFILKSLLFFWKKIIFVLMFTTHHLGQTKIELCQFMSEGCQLAAKFRNSSHHTNIFNAESTTEFKFICQLQTLSQRSTPLMNWLRSHLPSNNSSEFRLAYPKNW